MAMFETLASPAPGLALTLGSAIGRSFAFTLRLADNPICQTLREANVKLRLNAAATLGAIGDLRALEPLVATLCARHGIVITCSTAS